MKRLFYIIIISSFLYSCQTRVVSQEKPLQANSLELYQNYTIVTTTPAQYKVQVLRQDQDKIYTKNRKGEEFIINKNEIREVKKMDVFSSVVIGLAAIAAVVYVPI